MTILQAIIYGIVQGLTEFLPISSTAHIRIVPAIFGWDDPGAAFTAVMQIGTMLAVIIYFIKDILRLLKAFSASLIHMKPFESEDSRMAWWIGFGTIPISVCGLLLKHFIETSFRSLWVISFAMIVLALILIFAERISKFTRPLDSLTFVDTQAFGWAQALALIPGTSRSGATITAGMFLGFTREAAARFSFLLSIPAVALSGVYELWSIRHALTSQSGLTLIIATLVSGIIGYAAIELLLRYLRSHSMYLFVVYRFLLGIVIIIFILTGFFKP